MADNLVQNFLVRNIPPTVALKNALDAQAMRQRAHTQNIANAETPGYQRVRVEFENILSEALDGGGAKLAQSDPRHLTPSASDGVASAKLRVSREPVDPESGNINGVNIEEEMAEMAETQIRYLTSIELLKRRYEGMKTAIRGG